MQPHFHVCAALLLVACATAHGQSSDPKPTDMDWATWHMQEEHHINQADASSFFLLHDFDGDGSWEPMEIRQTYGLEDESNHDVPETRKEEIVRRILGLFDLNGDGRVSEQEFEQAYSEGRRLPDFGLGPGHHGDDEFEYEIHHWEKYHDENSREEDLIHPEDIAHFKKHDTHEEAELRLAQLDKLQIVEANIPAKFRRDAL